MGTSPKTKDDCVSMTKEKKRENDRKRLILWCSICIIIFLSL